MGLVGIITCDRCGSQIVNQNYHHESLTVFRDVDEDGWESKEMDLCSMCLDELWDWVEPEDSPDRSDVADPMSIERIEQNVGSHIDELEWILEQLTDRIERE